MPKEIRRTLRLREGTPLEIFTDREGEIILKKYSPMAELGAFAKQYAEALAQTSGHAVYITDRDQVIAVAGGKKELLLKTLSKQLEQMILNRESGQWSREDKKYTSITGDGGEDYPYQTLQVILSEGDAIGAVILMSKDLKNRMGETEQKLAAAAAGFLGRQLES